MKIDIGSNGKILGTKRVSPNGQVSGFTEYAGMDVLVILPGGSLPVVRRDAGDLLAEAELLVKERMELAFKEYQNLRARFASPEAAAQSFLRALPKSTVSGLVEKADQWIREQLARGRDSAPPPKPSKRSRKA